MAAPRLRNKRCGALLAAAAPLTAASAPVVNPQDVFKTPVSQSGRTDDWQTEAWLHYRNVGELRYYTEWRANACSRIRFVASEVDPETGYPTGGIDDDNAEGQRVAQIVTAIAGGVLGQAQLVKRAVQCLTIPGEFWMCILQTDKGEQWFAVSKRQIEKSGRNNGIVIKLPDGTKHQYNPPADGMFRIWNPDAEDATLADSPVRASLDPLREIVRCTQKIANADQSRLMTNGLLLVPSEASLPTATPAPQAAGKTGGETPDPAPQPSTATQLQNKIVDVATEGIKNPIGPAALIPMVVSAPGEQLKNVNHVDFGKGLTDDVIKIRGDAIMRLAMGLDVSPERLFGLGGTSHWSSWIVADQDVQMHLAPPMETLCQGIYDSVLANILAAEGIDPTKYTLWYDASHLNQDPDKTDESRDLFDRGGMTLQGLAKQFKLPEDDMYDLTTLEGCQEWARDRVAQDATLLPMLAPLLTALEGLEFQAPQQPAIEAMPGDDNAPGGHGEDSGAQNQQEPDTEDSSQQHAVLRSARFCEGDGPAATITDLLVSRALELAGKRRRTRADMDRLRHVPAHLTHRFMDPVEPDDVQRLIKGWDDIVDDSRLTSTGLSAELIRASVLRIARRELTSPVIDGQVL